MGYTYTRVADLEDRMSFTETVKVPCKKLNTKLFDERRENMSKRIGNIGVVESTVEKEKGARIRFCTREMPGYPVSICSETEIALTQEQVCDIIYELIRTADIKVKVDPNDKTVFFCANTVAPIASIRYSNDCIGEQSRILRYSND